MVDSGMLEEFKEKYLEALQEGDQNLPIVASIGKQSKGKSYFLNHLYEDIPNKDGQFVGKGTNVLHCKITKNFKLLDMEGLQGTEGELERDILNFSSTFAIASVVLLHISHDDLENSEFINNFAYILWHSFRVSSKFNLDLPKIILLLRDPRNKVQSEEAVSYYQTVAEGFEEGVNSIITKYESELIRTIEKVVNDSIKDKNEKEMAKNVVEKMKEDSKNLQFHIDSYYCIFCKNTFRKPIQYYEFNNNFKIEKSKFERLIREIDIYCCKKTLDSIEKLNFKREEYWEIHNELTLRIHEIISLSTQSQNKPTLIFENIYLEVKYNAFSHYSTLEGYLRFMEKYNKYYLRFEKLNGKISKNIKKGITQEKIRELKNMHAVELQKCMDENFDDNTVKEYAKAYIKYLSATSFSNTFALNPGIQDSCSYQQIFILIHFFTQKNTDHQKSSTTKNHDMYRCLEYFDNDFESMVKTLLRHNFKFFITLFCIYKQKIKYFQDAKYMYKQTVDKYFSTIIGKDFAGPAYELIQCLDLSEDIPKDLVFEFFYKLQKIEEKIVLKKLRKAEMCPEEVEVIVHQESREIYSFTLFEKLIPSMIGILIGLSSTIIRTIIVAAAVDALAATAAAASLAWLPIVGWMLFGATVLGSIIWVAYSVLNKIQSVKIKYSYYPKPGYEIFKEKIIKKQFNGEKLEEYVVNICSDGFEYKAKFSANVLLPKSAHITIIFIIYICKSDSQFVANGKGKIKDKYGHYNFCGVFNRIKDKVI